MVKSSSMNGRGEEKNGNKKSVCTNKRSKIGITKGSSRSQLSVSYWLDTLIILPRWCNGHTEDFLALDGGIFSIEQGNSMENS